MGDIGAETDRTSAHLLSRRRAPAADRRAMWLNQLALQNFRNYVRLGLELEPGLAVFCGRNGQGKTNLLEAIYVLATTRSPRASAERELVTWRASDDLDLTSSPPFARLEGRVRRHEGEVHLEILFKGDANAEESATAAELGAAGEVTGRLARTIKVNGLATRSAGLIGQLMVVYFAPEDVALASGSPSGRRRYLDVANSQVAPLYLRALQQYNRILLQRNQVLRQIRERRQPPAALAPWTDQMIRTGAFLLRQRVEMLGSVSRRAEAIFQDLAGSGQRMAVGYRSTVLEGPPVAEHLPETREIAQAYRARQEQLASREIEQAVSLVGPHRDDFAFVLDGVNLNVYGSRGQQRLAVLALKLAEADWMLAETGERPVLLLDDLLSELDPLRRRYVLHRVAHGEGDPAAERRQVWVTTTDTGDFPTELLDEAQRFDIDAGTLRRA